MKRILTLGLASLLASAFAWASLTPTKIEINAYKGTSKIGGAFATEADCEAFLKTRAPARNYKCRKDTSYTLTADPFAVTVVAQPKLATTTPAWQEVVAITPAVWSTPVTNQRWMLHVPTQGTFTLSSPSFTASWAGAAGTITELADAGGKTLTSDGIAFQTQTEAASTPRSTTRSIPVQGSIDARLPFLGYPHKVTVQVCGNYPYLYQTSETAGITSPCIGTVLGNPMRFGKVNDPNGSGRKVFRHALKASDPHTGPGVHRVDIIPPGAALNRGATYWVVWSMLLPSNTYFANDRTTLVNIHPGGSIGSVGVQINKGLLQAVKQSEPSPGTGKNIYWNLAPTPLADQWIKVAIKVYLANDSSGRLQIWVNGALKVDDSGPNAASAGGDYVKLAFYNYSWGSGIGDNTRPEREMFYGGLHIVKDAGYSEPQVRALLP